MNQEIISKELLDEIAEKIDTVYSFVMQSYDSYSKPKDYGSEEKFTMTEIHTLSLIADNPGIVLTDAAKMWNRTLSAASQNVSKLVKKGLVKKKKEKGNNKEVHLYATDKGRKLSKMHKEYDRKQMETFCEEILKHHTPDEVRTVYEVIKTVTSLYREEKLK